MTELHIIENPGVRLDLRDLNSKQNLSLAGECLGGIFDGS